MREFFRGWKRKAGVITLGLACVFMAGWGRGHRTIDTFTFGRDKSAFYVLSFSRLGVFFQMESASRENMALGYVNGWTTEGTLVLDTMAQVQDEIRKVRTQWPRFGFELDLTNSHSQFVRVPYWSIVLPLTFLSAYLLLSKPRSPKPTQPIESNHE